MSEMNAERVRKLYDTKARGWKWMTIPDTILGITRLRKKHFSGVTGDILDVACGTGENFKYLNGADSVTALDLSPQMVSEAKKRALQMGLDASIDEADASALPHEDDTFDYTISALSSCTFPGYVAAFREMERVTKPGGRILLLEHGRSHVGWVARRQDRSVNKHFKCTACRSNRDPRAEVEEAGLEVVSHKRSHLGMGHRMVVAVG